MSNPMDFSGGKGLDESPAPAAEAPEGEQRLAKLNADIEAATDFGMLIKDMIVQSGLPMQVVASALTANLTIVIAFATDVAGPAVGQALVNRISGALQGAVDAHG